MDKKQRNRVQRFPDFFSEIHFLLDKKKIYVILTGNMLCESTRHAQHMDLVTMQVSWFEVREVKRISKSPRPLTLTKGGKLIVRTRDTFAVGVEGMQLQRS